MLIMHFGQRKNTTTKNKNKTKIKILARAGNRKRFSSPKNHSCVFCSNVAKVYAEGDLSKQSAFSKRFHFSFHI